MPNNGRRTQLAEQSMTAHAYWDGVWSAPIQRAAWSRPDPWVVGTVPLLRRLNVRDVLDLGCGIGRHALFLARHGFAVWGCDRSDTAVAVATAESAAGGLPAHFTEAPITALPYADCSFDLVLAFNVVYHADEAGLGRTIDEIRRVLRPGGLYQFTMLSKRGDGYGRGIEVAANTFVQPDARDDKTHPHLYADAADLIRLHPGFQVLSAVDAEQTAAGTYHWYCQLLLGDDAAPLPAAPGEPA